MAVIKTVEDAFKLPVGKLSVLFSGELYCQVSVSPEDVATATKLILDSQDNLTAYSQAGIIVEAGKRGWGLGDAYKTF